MKYIIFHIPHSSLKIPNIFWSICTKDKEYIKESNMFLCDYLINDLVSQDSHKIVFKYSRLFCDVEKYLDDSKEIMSKKGMGAIYTNDCDNKITIPNKRYKRRIIKSYYIKHHNKIDKSVSKILKKYNKCIIIDLHSFSDAMTEKFFNSNNNPDICIGTNDIFTNKEILDFTINHFKKYGYTVEINKPYSGTIIPNKYINKTNTNLISIMIEINKRIYLNSKYDFNKLKKCINDYYDEIQL